MTSTKSTARVAGLLYLLMAITGLFNLMYVPGKLIVRGNATATASNILAHESLFRLDIVVGPHRLVSFIFAALALYRLLEGVDRGHAVVMVVLFFVQVPLAFVNELTHLAALAARARRRLPVGNRQAPAGGAGDAVPQSGRPGNDHLADFLGALAPSPSGCWCGGRASFPAFWAGGWCQRFRLSDQQLTGLLRHNTYVGRLQGHVPLPSRRGGVHAVAADHGRKAATAERGRPIGGGWIAGAADAPVSIQRTILGGPPVCWHSRPGRGRPRPAPVVIAHPHTREGAVPQSVPRAGAPRGRRDDDSPAAR